MWKEYSVSYIKNNKATSISIMVAALIASVFLSLICGVFYNMWTDNIRRIEIEEGDWQGRLVGNISVQDIQTIENHPNVKEAVFQETAEGEDPTVNVYFENPRNIYEDLPQIAGQIGIDAEKDASAVQYHNMLLTQYYIYSPQEKKDPPLLLTFYLFVMLLASFSLIMIIYNAFSVSMNARLHQLGILQSIGATPRQIRSALIYEAFALCSLPILVGVVAGIGLNYGFVQLSNLIGADVRKEAVVFDYNIIVFLVTLAACILTVWLSAWVSARKLGKLTPLEAVRNGAEIPVKKVKSYRFLSSLFGIEGELARKSIYVRRKAFRTSTLSLTLSFLVLSIFLNFMTLSDISTQHTYFERYKNTWDLLMTVKNQNSQMDELLLGIRNTEGVSDCTAYQKAQAYTYLPKELLSAELQALGGLEALKDTGIEEVNGRYRVEAPIIILDDNSFQEYCVSEGIDSTTDTVLVNTIWDSLNSHFRDPKYIPFLKVNANQPLNLFANKNDMQEQNAVKVNIGAYTTKKPKLREEFDNYSLVQIISQSTYRTIAQRIRAEKNETYYNILAVSENRLPEIQKNINTLMDGSYKYTLENRIEEDEYNAAARGALNLLMGILCGMMACIGLANVFSNTLGHIYQRRREFARYASIGLSPKGAKKVLFMEALIIGLKPILISLPLNVLFIIFAVTASRLQPMEFISRMPVIPLMIFAAVILICVGLAYYIGGKKICRYPIVESLKDDTML